MLMAIARALRAFAGSRTLSKAEERLKVAIEGAASTIGAPLLDADSLDDLGRRLDATVESKRTAAQFNELTRALAEDGGLVERISDADQGSHDWVIAVLGDGQRAFASEAERMTRAMVEAFEYLRRTLRLTFNADVSLPVFWNEDDPLGFLSARDVPPQIASAILGTYYSNVCFFAIISAGLTGRKLPPWLARTLAERWVQGIRGQLVLIASIPGTHVDEVLVPLDQRIDLEALVRESAEMNAAIDQFHRDADSANVDVYAPDPSR